MPPSEFEFVQGIKKRLLALNEIYQGVPFPGFGDLPARRGCEDRLKLIERLVPSEGRVIDVGSNLGYYCFRLAQMKNARCLGIECVNETYGICRDLAAYYQVPGAEFLHARVSPELLLDQEPADLILLLAVLHHVLRDHGLPYVESILDACRERGKEILVELPAPEEEGWKAGKDIAFPDPVLTWLLDLGFYPEVAMHVKSHVGTERPFIHLRPMVVKQGDERYEAEIHGWAAATGVPGVPHFYTHYTTERKIYGRYIPGTTLDTGTIGHGDDQLRMWGQLARTIAGLHARGVVHGDVRSWNVILNPERVHLVDFGLSITKEYQPTDYQWGVYAGLPDTKDWDWLGLAAMQWYASHGRTQPKHPYDWLPNEIEENKLQYIQEAKSWAQK